MLVELAIGDAYGAGYEFADREIVDAQNLEYIKHQLHDIPKGHYTDDTQMSIALAELIVENKEFTSINIANKFVECFKRDVRYGYAGKFYDFLRVIKTGEEFLEKIKPDSVKNGSAMRAVPLGIFKDVTEVIDKSTKQAKITHNTKVGIDSAVVVSLLSHYFVWGKGEKKDMMDFVLQYVKGDWDKSWNEEVSGNGEITVRAVITILKRCSTLKEILFESIALGGDVDSVASIAMGIASECKEFKKDIPEILLYNLEMTKYGRYYLESLDNQLIEFKSKQ
jgi:ADP-ribosyl-[dinitrogen reductase] hydrolase